MTQLQRGSFIYSINDPTELPPWSLSEPRKLHAPTHRPEFTMASTHSKARKQKPRTKKRTINPWTAADLKSLRTQAGRTSATKIAKALKRTEGAVRQKAGSLGLSLRLR